MEKFAGKVICILLFTGSFFAQDLSINKKNTFPVISDHYSIERHSGFISGSLFQYSGLFSTDPKEVFFAGNIKDQEFLSFTLNDKKEIRRKHIISSLIKTKIKETALLPHNKEKIFLKTKLPYNNALVKNSVGSNGLFLFTDEQPQNSPAHGGNMPDIPKRALIAGALFVPTMIAGYWLTNTGNPPNTFLLTSHKLTALADLILLNYTVYQKMKITSLEPVEIAAAIIMNLCFAGTMTTGALSCADNPAQWVKTVHSAGPWLTIISSGALLYLLNSMN